MAYNNTFPVSYQPAQIYYPTQNNTYPTQMNVAPTQSTQTSSIIWVQGEAGAKSYLVAPNTTVQLWDSEAQVIYLKSADASGMPSMKILDYTIRNEAPAAPVSTFDTSKDIIPIKDDLNRLQRQIDALRGDVDKLKGAGGAEDE